MSHFVADYDLILTCSGNISDVHITPTPRAPTVKPTETDNHGKGPKYTEKSIHTTTVTFTGEIFNYFNIIDNQGSSFPGQLYATGTVLEHTLAITLNII